MIAAITSVPAAVHHTRTATPAARAALAGVTLHTLKDECGRLEWMASRWALSWSFRSPEELSACLDMIGAPR